MSSDDRSQAARTAVRWRSCAPGPELRASLRPPPSKSLAQRALLIGACAEGTTRLRGLGPSRAADLDAAAAFVEQLGARVLHSPPDWRVQAPAVLRPRGALQVGESGTLLRMGMALSAFAGTDDPPAEEPRSVRIEARGTLLQRASPALLDCLQRAGVQITRRSFPLEFERASWPGTLLLEQPGSSQEVSALLVVLARGSTPGVLTVRGSIPSAPYVAMTCAVLRSFGAQVSSSSPAPDAPNSVGAVGAPGATHYSCCGPLRAPPAGFDIEPDASAAAVALAAGCLSGGRIAIEGLGQNSSQGDCAIVEDLAAFGCVAGAEANSLHAGGRPTRGANLDLSQRPDTAPVLAAVAAGAALTCGASSLLTGLGTLPGKESSRIEVLARGLRAAGLRATDSSNSLRIEPPPRPIDSANSTPVELDPAGDHRMAFAFALLGLLRPGLRVLEPGCVAKSWPEFWEDMVGLGARVASA